MKSIEYWWDFYWEGGKLIGIWVESSHRKYPYIKFFPLEKREFADNVIALAEKLISDLQSGRKSIKSII